MYAFSGSTSLLTYLHMMFDWNTRFFINFNLPVLITAVLAALFFSYKKSLTAAQGALIGFLIFLAFMYRVNYQYFIVYMPLALLVAAKTRFLSERIMALVVAMIPAAWLWMFNVSFWFDYLAPRNSWVDKILGRIGMTHIVPDYGFVSLAMVLMCLFIAYIVLTFVKWRQPADRVSID
jgi:hypothetical protein